MKFKLKSKENRKSINCLNCGFPFQHAENFCPYCGQKNDSGRLNMHKYLSDFFNTFFSYDSALFKTISVLVFKPAKFAKDYISGKRKTYTNPFRLLLNISLIYFLLNGLFGIVFNQEKSSKKDKTGTEIQTPFKNYSPELDSIFAKDQLKIFFNNKQIPKQKKDSAYRRLFYLRENGISKKDGKEMETQEIDPTDIFSHDILRRYFLKHGINYHDQKISKRIKENFNELNLMVKSLKMYRVTKNFKTTKNVDAILDSLGLSKSKSNLKATKIAIKFNKITAHDEEGRNAFRNAVLSKITISLFFILPIYALFFRLFYIREKYNYTENLVLIFNIQTVFFILLLVDLLLGTFIPSNFLFFVFNLWFAYYIYKSLKKFYRQSHWITFLKTFLLVIPTYLVLAIIGFMGIFIIAIYF